MTTHLDLSSLSRRSAIKGWFATGAAIIGHTILAPAAHASDTTLPATPACGEDIGPTRSMTEGPFYSQNPPEKRNFRTDTDGSPVTLIGYVLSTTCTPIANAIVDLWHADANGRYDNQGFSMRGYQRTDAQGRYYFDTIRPAEYAGRTPHYHIKITPPNGPTLTTQLYFPEEPRNELDHLFDSALLMKMRPASDGEISRFDFVLA
ncbi:MULTISPECIES: intradiol ring-cleavage dioxygenase [unclassified Thalassospira]|uniref:dioxygenase family protein n=1 Tax=unclassified Thalassospira TaxID=2648997 RepID=UPI000C58B0F8|nr:MULTISPECIES: intradiol ring-cleavage dioxygenase [unclassified Thalassospira]MBC45875.1 intradiol ring-cleavage dioxygenase [Thalassospira sp.]HAI32962.1 intradiol ring-cleavage dioxygenase [Thalassospira sp.]|tara:strand:- start:2553 stop:3167 length:615 start_codon:yes stop_codon:yes gene_type:complete